MKNIVEHPTNLSSLLGYVTDMLKAWDAWDYIDEDVEYTVSGTTVLGTFFYPDSTRKVALVVQSLDDQHPVVGGVQICQVDTYSSVVVLKSLNVVDAIGAVQCMQNNTALCISIYRNDTEGMPTTTPISFFVANTVSQSDGTSGSALGVYAYEDDANTGYILYTSNQTYEVSYPIVSGASYTTLLPLIGLNQGVLSGIYYPLMLEDAVVKVKTMHIKDKTFYRCGVATMIDYYVG